MSRIIKNVAKKILGIGGEKYLPYAIQKLQQLAQQYQGFPLDSVTRVDDGSVILLHVRDGDNGSVTITGGDFGYEFMTTGAVLNADLIDGSLIYRGYIVGGKADVPSGTVKSRGLGATISSNVTAASASQRFTRKNLFQVQAIPEHAYFPKWNGAGTRPYLVDSWTASSDLVTAPVFSNSPYSIGAIDFLYDVAPTLFADINKPAESATVPDTDWYKRAAFRTVTSSDFGARSFVILTDARNNFYVYPAPQTKDPALASASIYSAQQIKTTIANGTTKVLPAPLPSWARAMSAVAARDYIKQPSSYAGGAFDVASYIRQFPTCRWAFNSTGTLAAAIVLQNLPPVIQSNGGVGQEFSASGVVFDVQSTLPGLVELAIDIRLTGPNPGDFIFTLAVAQALDPKATHRYFMAVDYAFAVPGACAADDMIVLEGDLYVDDNTQAVPGILTATAKVLNKTTETVIHTLVLANLFPYPVALYPMLAYPAFGKILAYDLRILGIVTQQSVIYTNLAGGVNPDFLGGLEEHRADRLVTMAYGAVVRTQNIDPTSSLNGMLPVRFDAVNLAGLTRSDPYGTDATFYSSNISVPRYRYPTGGEVSYPWTGPDNYAAYLAAVLTPTAHECFSVHPEGHWSVITKPSFYFSGPAPQLNYLHLPSHGSDLAYAQDFVDIVRFNALQPDGTYAYIDTNHIDMANAAFDLKLTKQSFFYSAQCATVLEYTGNPGTAGVFNVSTSYAKIFRPGEKTPFGYYSIGRTIPELLGRYRADSDRGSLTRFDPRDGVSDRYFTQALPQIDVAAMATWSGGYIPYLQGFGNMGLFYTDTPLVRGSSLFFGTLNKIKATP